MQPIPRPDQIEGYLGDIDHAVSQIRRLWLWAHPDSHRRPQHGSSEVVSGGGRRDLSDTVTATERYRTYLRHAGREVVDARNRLLGAVADLNDALNLLEPPQTPEVADVRLYARPEDEGGIRRAREAKGRREERARATGDWSEVTG